MIRARTLGTAEIVVERTRITPKTEVMFALAIYVCVRAGERIPRGTLAELFWPNTETLKARHNLRQMMYRLRQAGIEFHDDGDLIGLDVEEVSCDLTRIASEAWPQEAAPDEIAQSAEFLPHFTPTISEDYARWLDATRASVSAQFRRAAIRQIESARRQARWVELERWADVLLRSDPLSEEGTLAKAESVAMSGSKALALEILDGYVVELGEYSSQIALPASVLRRRISERTSEWSSRATNDVAFVGRPATMLKLTALIEHARAGAGGAVLLHGAPGIGKTRLCLEARSYAAFKGMRILSVRADDASSSRPLELLSAIASLLNDLPGAAGSPPAAMAIVRRLLDPSGYDTGIGAGQAPNISMHQISWAVTEMLRAASEACALLIHLDDVHNADTSSLEVLRPILTRIKACRIAVLATARSHWVQPGDEQSRDGFPAPRLHVPPLSEAESEVLTAAFSRALPRPLVDEEERRLARDAGGNPLFIKELCAQRAGMHSPDFRSRSLAEVIEQRCARLRIAEVRLLRLISLLGGLATLQRLRLLAQSSTHSLADSVESLERDGLICMESPGTLALHECWRDAIDADTPRATRAALALECAQSLSEEDTEESQFEIGWRRGLLYAQASCDREAMDCFRRAGDRLLTIGVPLQAAEAYSTALSHATDPSSSASLCLAVGTAQNAALLTVAAAESCRQALVFLSHRVHDRVRLRAEIMVVLAEAEWKAFNTALDSLDELAALACDLSLPTGQRNACCYAGMRITCGHDGRLARHFVEASVITGESVVADWTALATHMIFEAEFGDAVTARRLIAALSSAELAGLPSHTRLAVLRHQSAASRMIGDFELAASLAQQSVALAIECGLVSSTVWGLLLLAFGHLDKGEFAEALRCIEQARDWDHSPEHDERVRSVRHVFGRYLLAAGKNAECLLHYAPHLEQVRSDAMRQRRAVESACISLAAAREGNRELASEALDIVLPVLRCESPSHNLDFAADAVVESLTLIGDSDASDEFGFDYLARRGQCLKRALAPALTNLQRLTDLA